MRKIFWFFFGLAVFASVLWIMFEKGLRIERASYPAKSTAGFNFFPQTVSKDWWYAFYWDPGALIPGVSEKNRRSDFVKIKVMVSKKKIVTPSGTPVYRLKKTPVLKKLFTYNPKHLIYLFVSSSLEAFTDKVVWDGKKANGVPAAWFTLKFIQVKKPGLSLTLIIPKKRLENMVDQNWKQVNANARGWLSVSIPEIQPNQVNIEKGKEIYTQYCSACHGIYGNGGGPLSVFLFPKPRDFRSGEFKFKTTFEIERPLTSDLYRTVSNGLLGTAMPSFRFLTQLERWDVVKYIEGFSISPQTGEKLFSTPPPKKVLKIHQPDISKEVFLSEMKEGEKLFFGAAGCSSCHGPGVNSRSGLPKGDGPSAPASLDDWGYPDRPANLADGVLKRGDSPREIYTTISTGIPGTSMPTYDTILNDRQRWALAFYVSNLNKTHSNPLPVLRKHSSAFKGKKKGI